MKLLSTEGELLVKQVLIKIIVPKCKTYPQGLVRRVLFKSPKGKGFTEAGIENVLYTVANKLDNDLPDFDFTLVRLLRRGHFNLIGELKDAGREESTGNTAAGSGEPGSAVNPDVCSGERSSPAMVLNPSSESEERVNSH